MIISLIAAIDQEGGIARQGRIPWRLSSDLRRFKALTMGHHILMGRKTYESIGKPLPRRTNVIITRQAMFPAEGCLVVHSLSDALHLAQAAGETEAFIIGGGEIYTQALPLAQRVYLTRVQTRAACDVFFPPFFPGEWRLLSEESFMHSDRDQFASIFQIYERSTG